MVRCMPARADKSVIRESSLCPEKDFKQQYFHLGIISCIYHT
jgi:hypothetical protein